MTGPVCKQCGSRDVAWREGKNGGRYLIERLTELKTVVINLA